MAATTLKQHKAITTAKKTTSKIQKPIANTTIKCLIPANMQPQLDLIAASTKTPFEKRVLSLLCQVPRGRVTTYGLMSRHLQSSPRAIGNAMRRNPFAPLVPCHRVVATGGGLGGFKGVWNKAGEGITLDEKRVLLRGEGVRFDEKGRVVGTPWEGFV